MTIFWRIAFFLALLHAFGVEMARGQSSSSVTVLVSSDSAPSEEVVLGLRQCLASKGAQAELTVYSLGGDATKGAELLEKLKKDKKHPVVTLGSLATNMARKEIKSWPIVAGLVLDAEDLRPKENVTGVFLEFPLEVQLDWMKRMLPATKNVGVLYNSERNSRRIQEAVRIASGKGVEIHAQRVSAPSDIPNALEALVRKVDVLWGIPDELVLNPQTGRHILLFSYRNSIPFVGLSETWVKAGALYALGWDYRDIGDQCGGLLLRVLKGADPSGLEPEPPRRTYYTVNTRTAYHMKLDLPAALLKGAQHLVE